MPPNFTDQLSLQRCQSLTDCQSRVTEHKLTSTNSKLAIQSLTITVTIYIELSKLFTDQLSLNGSQPFHTVRKSLYCTHIFNPLFVDKITSTADLLYLYVTMLKLVGNSDFTKIFPYRMIFTLE